MYNHSQGTEYWKWCFENPFGYINSGMFEGNRLIGYYAAQFTENSACMYSAMVHPKHRKKGIYLKLTTDLHERLSMSRSFVYLYSNKMIRPIHLEKEGYVELYQIKEYRIPINKAVKPFGWINYPEYDSYNLWRYRNHPLVKYIYHQKGNLSNYEDRIQIVSYEDLMGLGYLIQTAEQIGYWDKKKYMAFWSEMELDYPYVLLPLWKQYKIFNENITSEDIKMIDKNRMGMCDIF